MKQVQAKRTSNNRQKGTWETKAENVNYDLYLEYVLNKVIPSIIAKWPRRSIRRGDIENVAIQHDNAPVHFDSEDEDFQRVAVADHRFKFFLREQPANSPDTNVLDLGFFCSLQSKQWRYDEAKNIDDLIENVELAWNDYDPVLLNRVFISHQTCLDEIIKSRGDNTYKIPHTYKEQKEKDKDYLQKVEVTADAITVLAEENIYDEYFTGEKKKHSSSNQSRDQMI